MERMAFNPLPGVQQAAHGLNPGRHGNAKRLLDCQNTAHLVGYRANAANARHNVRDFFGQAPLEKFLEKPGRLKNP